MREKFHLALENLEADVVRMGEYVTEAVGRATTALVEGDERLAGAVVDADEQIDALYIHIESNCHKLLAQQQPVAKDLRRIISMLRVVQDLERSGDLVKNVAGMVRGDVNMVKLKPVAEIVGQLGLLTQALLSAAVSAFAEKDPTVSEALEKKDDKVDTLYKELITELFRIEKDSSLELALNLALTGRFFERIGDHAVNVAVWVNYLETGVLSR